MTVEQSVGIVSSLLDGRWLDSEEAAAGALQELGFAVPAGAGRQLTGGSVQHDLEHPAGIDHASLTTADGEPVSVIFLLASVPEPQSMATTATYRALLAALSDLLGAPERVWPDQPTPVQWRTAELDVGAQLFDRRDSSVMVWVEHRARSQQAELRAR